MNTLEAEITGTKKSRTFTVFHACRVCIVFQDVTDGTYTLEKEDDGGGSWSEPQHPSIGDPDFEGDLLSPITGNATAMSNWFSAGVYRLDVDGESGSSTIIVGGEFVHVSGASG